MMHQNDLSGAALLVLAYQNFTKRLAQVPTIAGWALSMLLVSWLLQNVNMPSITLLGSPMRNMVPVEHVGEVSLRVESMAVELAQRTQG